jgi:hypothetical protein
MAISKKAWTGIAREATPGTAVMTPSKYIPTKTTFKGGKKREYLNEERGTRDGNYGVVDSVRQSTIDMKGPYYNDVHPYAHLLSTSHQHRPHRLEAHHRPRRRATLLHHPSQHGRRGLLHLL